MMKSISPVHALSQPAVSFDIKMLQDPSKGTVDVQTLLKCDWTSSEKSAQEFLDTVINLVSYNGCYIPACFNILVRGFIPKSIYSVNPDLTDKISHMVHQTLQKIVSIVPLSTTILGEALKEQFPHKRCDSEELFVYLKNLLLVSYYAPSLIESLITTAVDRLIQLDVDIKLEDPDEPEVAEGDTQFSLEIEEGSKRPSADVLAARKLDSMMVIMFEYLDAAFGTCKGEKRDDPPQFTPMHLNATNREHLFKILLLIFDKYILPTYKSKFTQFLLFYVCRIKPEGNSSFSTQFMAYLFNKIQQSQRSANQLASASYLGGILTRASYVPAATRKEVVLFMLNWALDYLNSRPNANPDAVVHGLFYSISQALFHVFIYHKQVLLEGGHAEALKKGYCRIVQSNLNPLKFIYQPIAHLFVKRLKKAGWSDFTSLLEQNEKLVLATKSSFGGENKLDLFFPFDPYLLQISHRYLDGSYLHYQREEGDEDDEEEGDEAEEAEEEEEDEEEVKEKPKKKRHAAFADDSDSDSEDEDEGRQSSDDLDQLTNDFMHFTPDVERDISFHLYGM